MTELQERIDIAKIHLYTLLLEKEETQYTQTEAEILFFLSGDKAIQEKEEIKIMDHANLLAPQNLYKKQSQLQNETWQTLRILSQEKIKGGNANE